MAPTQPISTLADFKALLNGVYENTAERLVLPDGSLRRMKVAVIINYEGDDGMNRWLAARSFDGQMALLSFLMRAAESTNKWHIDPTHTHDEYGNDDAQDH